MSYVEDNLNTGRILLPDLVRAFALLGIVLVNIAYIAYPAELTYHAGGMNTWLDKAADFGVNALFSLKSYTLFAFMFGVGLAYQMHSAERHNRRFGPVYFRRLLGLILIGMLHVTLAFSGDILIVYGLLGAVLYLFRNASQKTLLVTGVTLVVIQFLIAAGLAVFLYLGELHVPDEMKLMATEIQQSTELAIAINTNGDFLTLVKRRWYDWVALLQVAIPMQGPGIFGFILFGLAAVRSGVLTDPEAALWAKSRRVYLPIGVLLSVVGAAILTLSHYPISSSALLGYALIVLAAPFSSLGYIGLIAKWSEGPVTPLKEFAARGGSASLTAYLLQSVILSFIFTGYGLDMYAKLSAFSCIAIALLVGLFTLTFTSLWRARFKRGPMELILRQWTYLGHSQQTSKAVT